MADGRSGANIPPGSGVAPRSAGDAIGSGAGLSASEALQLASFTLKIRVVTPALQPFSSRDYQLDWGGVTLEGQLDDQGYLTQTGLNGEVEFGTLRLGVNHATKGFSTRITIPLERHLPRSESTYEGQLSALGYRLANLGLLPLHDVQPGKSAILQPDEIIEAAARYRFRFGLRDPLPRATSNRNPVTQEYFTDGVVKQYTDDLTGLKWIDKGLLDHVKRTHGG